LTKNHDQLFKLPRRVGIEVIDKIPVRHEYNIVDDKNNKIGFISSGIHSH